MTPRGICALCRGSGNLWCQQEKHEWHVCPGCGGAGVRYLYSAPIINAKFRRETA